jgi:hypothetical protein
MRRLVLAALLLALAPAPARAQQASGTPVVGGGSFNNAPLLKPGHYSDTIAAGETDYYGVTLAKGQVLHVKMNVDTSQLETDVAADDYKPGLSNLDYRVDIFSPLHEQLSNETPYDKATVELQGDSDAEAKTGEATGPRALGYEQILGPDYDLDKFPGPGEWFFSLSAADSDYQPAEAPAEFPIDFTITVDGTPEPSSPNFAAKLPTSTPTPAATAAPFAPVAQSGPGDPVVTIALVAVLALLGGLALGALAVVVLGLGRRRSRA